MGKNQRTFTVTAIWPCSSLRGGTYSRTGGIREIYDNSVFVYILYGLGASDLDLHSVYTGYVCNYSDL